jgi:hypothetical protein
MSKKIQKYSSCWEYRENETCDYKIIMTVGNEKNMFLFPFENQIGYRDKNKEFKTFDENTVTDMFGYHSSMKDVNGVDFVGFSYIYGGKVIGEIPSYWNGDKIKFLTKELNSFPKAEKIFLNLLIDDDNRICIPEKLHNLRFDMEKYCQIKES